MPTVRYDGPGRVLNAFGKTLARYGEAEFTDAEVRSLLAQPHIRISVDGIQVQVTRTGGPRRPLPAEALRPSVHGSRRQWAAYAEERGITVTDGMTRDEIAAAVDAPKQPTLGKAALELEIHAPPFGGGEPEAEPGEGHHTNPEEEETP